MKSIFLKKRALSARLSKIKKRIIILSKSGSGKKEQEKHAIRSELFQILNAHKLDEDLKSDDRHFYSKILKSIASNIFLLEKIK